MTHFVKQGSSFHLTNNANLDIHTSLPLGTYVLLFDPNKGYYLDTVDNMQTVTKFYGNLERYKSRIVETYLKRDCNTGVLLSGEKGTGKTLLLRAIANELATRDIPVILINDQHAGEAFNKFLSMVTQECIVCFDEFEKVYDREHQEAVLTLLDGVFNSKKLFVFTCNDRYKLNSHMINRPGRIFYHISYSGLEESAIIEYCNDNLNNKENIQGLLNISRTIHAFNFDMLKGLVEEMNRFDENAIQAVALMNIRPDSTEAYEVEMVFPAGFEYKISGKMRKFIISKNPLVATARIDYRRRLINVPAYESDEYDHDIHDDQYHEALLENNMFVGYEGRSMIFKDEEGIIYKVLAKESSEFNYNSLAF